MKKIIILLLMGFLAVGLIPVLPLSAATIVPYRTYTEDSNGNLIMTQDAYVPVYSFTHEELDNVQEIQLVGDYLFVLNQKPGRSKMIVFTQDFEFVKSLSLGMDVMVPGGFYIRENLLYIADEGLDEDGAIHLFDFNLEDLTISYSLSFGKPVTPLFGERTPFMPTKIAVDNRGNMYIVSEGALNGILQMSSAGRFFGFFGANLSDVPRLRGLWNQFFRSSNQIQLPPTPTNLTVDKEGFIYTVTDGLSDTGLKKFNVASRNFLPSSLNVVQGNIDVAIGNYQNIFTLSKDGIIREYDVVGNLLFSFGGSLIGDTRMGLFQSPSAIAINERNQILVSDSQTNLIQVFERTEFAMMVHFAIEKYFQSEFDKGIELWNDVLLYNAWFDLAYKGMADAMMSKGDYELAMMNYRKTNDIEGYSNAFWELRNNTIEVGVGWIVIFFFGIQIFYLVKRTYNKKGHTILPKSWHDHFNRWKQRPLIQDLVHPFKIIRHPLDTFFDIKHKIHSPIWGASLIYFAIAVVYFIRLYGSSYIFIGEINQSTVFLNLVLIYAGVFLFVIMNYLVCTIREGSGFFRDVYIGVAYSLMPILLTVVGMTFLSNILTLNEAFLYQYIHQIAFVWSAILLYFMVKDIHHYEVGESLGNIVITIFSMLVMIFVGTMVYVIFTQSFGFIEEVVGEAMLRATGR